MRMGPSSVQVRALRYSTRVGPGFDQIWGEIGHAEADFDRLSHKCEQDLGQDLGAGSGPTGGEFGRIRHLLGMLGLILGHIWCTLDRIGEMYGAPLAKIGSGSACRYPIHDPKTIWTPDAQQRPPQTSEAGVQAAERYHRRRQATARPLSQCKRRARKHW